LALIIVSFLNQAAILSISPNPANEQISLQWEDKTANPTFMEVRNVLGNVVFKEKIRGNVDGQVSFNIKDFAVGMYGVSLFFEGKRVLVGKFVKI
jgi:Secretion system C-terminal sorting domain